MKKSKKFIGILAAVMMVITILPAGAGTVYAGEFEQEINDTVINNATEMVLDQNAAVVWTLQNEGINYFHFKAPETGYYTLSSYDKDKGDVESFINLYDIQKWYSLDMHVTVGFTCFMIKDFDYYIGAYADGGNAADHWESDGYLIKLSKAENFSLFGNDCQSWDVGTAEDTAVTFPAITDGRYYRAVRVTVPEDGNYRFTARISNYSYYTWPALFDEDGNLLCMNNTEQVGEAGADLKAGRSYYLIPCVLAETMETVVELTGRPNDPLTSYYCTNGTYHEYQNEIVKATFDTDGSFREVCPACGKVGEEWPINKVDYVELENESGLFEYTGEAIEPEIDIRAGGTGLVPSDYRVEYKDNTEPGPGQVIIILQGDNYEGTKTLNFTIYDPENPLKQTITIGAGTEITKTYGNAAFSLKAKTTGDGKLTYSSSDTGVATVSSKGKVTIKGAGQATITVRAAASNAYKSASKKVKLTVNKAKNPLTASAAKKTNVVSYKALQKGTQYIAAKDAYIISGNKGKVTFEKTAGTGKITVNEKTGKIRIKKGMKKDTYKIKVKIKAAGNDNYKPGSKTVTLNIKVK